MINKSDLQNAQRDLAAARRAEVEPPSAEEVEALFRGDLGEEEAERVRQALAYYPDMVRAMTDQQLAADLAAADAASNVVPFPQRRLVAIAAGILVALLLGGVYFQSRDTTAPRQLVVRVLDPDGVKGGTRGAPAQTPISLATGTDYLLKPLFQPERTYGDYRLELVDLGTSPPRRVWSRDGVRRAADGSFPAELRDVSLEPGLHELVLYGVEGNQTERLATYTIRFASP